MEPSITATNLLIKHTERQVFKGGKEAMVARVRECADYLNGTLMFSAITNTPSFSLHIPL
jgi:hypothetical protein